MKHISTSERILQASYHRKEKEIAELKEKLSQYREQLEIMRDHIAELKDSNNQLINQISYLVSYRKNV